MVYLLERRSIKDFVDPPSKDRAQRFLDLKSRVIQRIYCEKGLSNFIDKSA